jgi:hypothetical protein
MAMPYYTMPMMSAPGMPVASGGMAGAAPAYYTGMPVATGGYPAPLVTGVMPPGIPMMAPEQPGSMLNAFECARYGVPFGAVWGGAVSSNQNQGGYEEQQQEPESQDDGAHGTQV